MALSDRTNEYVKRLMMSRLRILVNHGFYGLLLMHMTFSLDSTCKTAATDGRRIFFDPSFLDEISDTELDFILMHEILHVVLQHCFRQGERDNERYNIACDIVVNSNIMKANNMNVNSITLQKYGESMHIAPDGKEGYEHTAEEVYEMLPEIPSNSASGSKGGASGRSKKQKGGTGNSSGWDDHTRWGTYEDDDSLRDAWVKRTLDAIEAISIRDPSNKRGLLPAFAQRILKELRDPQINWRMILNDFVQEEITDYSFTPPDRRFDDSPFFLPEFNDKEDIVEDILFMIDTSGSMSDYMITSAFSEVKGAIDQFDGKLRGWLGFFDASVVEPKPFESIDDLKIIKPVGGGGTDFGVIFAYVEKKMQDKLPASIIILTDGYAPFPKERSAMGIPVLWLITNTDIMPPWGKVARITE